MSRVSIKDVARLSRVSHSTVSRALNGSPLVRAETRQRIQRVAQELGYSVDAQARSLVKGRTLTLGLVVTTIADPFIAEIVQAIETTAHDAGYSVILSSSNAEPEREIAAVDMLKSKRVDGMIVTSSRIGALYLDHLERLGVPIVLINSHREERGPYTFSIGVDNLHGGWLATRHLIDCGHRRIAYVSGCDDHSSDLARMAGYRKALAEAGIRFDPGWLLPGNGRTDGGERALQTMLELPRRATALFCYNDMSAIGLMGAARRVGIALPHELAVVGFDDIPFARYVHPRLTTVAQPKAQMGRQAVEMVLDLIGEHRKEETITNTILQGELVVRESSGPPAGEHSAEASGHGQMSKERTK